MVRNFIRTSEIYFSLSSIGQSNAFSLILDIFLYSVTNFIYHTDPLTLHGLLYGPINSLVLNLLSFDSHIDLNGGEKNLNTD
jgi:hypothetical protein